MFHSSLNSYLESHDLRVSLRVLLYSTTPNGSCLEYFSHTKLFPCPFIFRLTIGPSLLSSALIKFSQLLTLVHDCDTKSAATATYQAIVNSGNTENYRPLWLLKPPCHTVKKRKKFRLTLLACFFQILAMVATIIGVGGRHWLFSLICPRNLHYHHFLTLHRQGNLIFFARLLQGTAVH